MLALSTLVAQYGFYLTPEQEYVVGVINLAIVAMFLLEIAIQIIGSPNTRRAVTTSLPLIILFAVFGLQLLLARYIFGENPDHVALLERFNIRSLTRLYVLLLQWYIVFNLVFHSKRITRHLATSGFRTTQVLVAAFVALILIGTVLLSLPRATPPDGSLSLIDAFFLSTSASCVTGLSPVDVSTVLSRTGQVFLLLLIQIGGLGIVTFTAFFGMLLGEGLSIKERVMIGEVMDVKFMNHLSRFIGSIVLTTLVVELAGAATMYFQFPADQLAFGDRVFNAVFHSISAFCNAGFSLYPNSLEGSMGNWWLGLTVMVLVFVGGLGFVVHEDILRILRNRVRGTRRRGRLRLRLQTRLVLTASFALIVGGAIVFAAAGLGPMDALFQSVTTRTAGFNTVSQGDLPEVALFVSMLLMFVGGAPGSTAGGIKVTTMVVLGATVWGMLRGRAETDIGKRAMPPETVREAFVVSSLSVFAVAICFVLLLALESAPFDQLLFETVSAFGTVGLSMGVTSELGGVSKVIVSVLMLFGRVGPLTIALAVTERIRQRAYAYPVERVMVG